MECVRCSPAVAQAQSTTARQTSTIQRCCCGCPQPTMHPSSRPRTRDRRRSCHAKPSTFSRTKRSAPAAPMNAASLNFAEVRNSSKQTLVRPTDCGAGGSGATQGKAHPPALHSALRSAAAGCAAGDSYACRLNRVCSIFCMQLGSTVYALPPNSNSHQLACTSRGTPHALPSGFSRVAVKSHMPKSYVCKSGTPGEQSAAEQCNMGCMCMLPSPAGAAARCSRHANKPHTSPKAQLRQQEQQP